MKRRGARLFIVFFLVVSLMLPLWAFAASFEWSPGLRDLLRPREDFYVPKLPPHPEDAHPLPYYPPKATPKPQSSPTKSKFVTSMGPLFSMYRGDLASGQEMFTPIDLDTDGDLFVPLVSSNMHIVGVVKVTVRQGMVTVRPYVLSEVVLKKGTFTFFDDINAAKSLKASRLKSVNLSFHTPVHVEKRLGTDSKVLMYINCPVSYKAKTAGLIPFSFEQQEYMEQVTQMIALMD